MAQPLKGSFVRKVRKYLSVRNTTWQKLIYFRRRITRFSQKSSLREQSMKWNVAWHELLKLKYFRLCAITNEIMRCLTFYLASTRTAARIDPTCKVLYAGGGIAIFLSFLVNYAHVQKQYSKSHLARKQWQATVQSKRQTDSFAECVYTYWKRRHWKWNTEVQGCFDTLFPRCTLHVCDPTIRHASGFQCDWQSRALIRVNVRYISTQCLYCHTS